MFRGIYVAASGMTVEQHRQEVVANNLANVNTSGFKRDEGVYGSFNEILLMRMCGNKTEQVLGQYNLGVKTLADTATDYAEGGHFITENPLDLAIAGPGFFTVETPDGIRYTRNGSFSLDPEGRLITKDGFYVLGENGPITLSAGSTAEIANDGSIRQGGQTVDRIKLVDFSDKSALRKEGINLWQASPQAQTVTANGLISQGFLEASNVNVIKEMVAMIEVQRAYNLDQKVVQTFDEILAKAANEIGRIR